MTAASALSTPTAGSRASRERLLSLAIWLGGVLLAGFFALILRDSTVVDGSYLPRTNDSFYHAHRILDALGSRGFYQFDDDIHAPEGSWISWPWAYDRLLVQAAKVAQALSPHLDPLAFLSYVPVAWLLVNAALFMACAAAIGLSLEMRLLAMLSFALSPLTQMLHSIGMLDHHYVEHTFVLLSLWLGLHWFAQPDDPRRAAALGVALGLAPAFHNGLFILQLPPLTCVFVLWLRGACPPAHSLRAFAIALMVASQLVLLPSEPYRRGMFEFGLLSWFHFYVAACTGVAVLYMGWRAATRRRVLGLAALCAALAAPLAAQVLSAAGFLTGSFSILDQIVEMRSPYRLFVDTFGPVETASYYSWLLPLAPLLLLYYGYRAFKERDARSLYFAISAVFGLALLLDQLRLQYFGFFAFVAGTLLVVDDLRARLRWHRGATFVVAFAAIVLAYQPAFQRLFIVYAPAADPAYAGARDIFRDLHDRCAVSPGVVLASSDDGSPIVFHSDCKVIANNFILRAEDKAHLDEIDRLMRSSPEEIRATRPDVKYVFVRALDFSSGDKNKSTLAQSSAMARELFLSDSPPPGYTLLRTVRKNDDDPSPAGIYARLFEVAPMGR